MLINFDYALLGCIPVEVEASFEMTTFAMNDEPQLEMTDMDICYEGASIINELDSVYTKRRSFDHDGFSMVHDAKCVQSSYNAEQGKLSVTLEMSDKFVDVIQEIEEKAYELAYDDM